MLAAESSGAKGIGVSRAGRLLSTQAPGSGPTAKPQAAWEGARSRCAVSPPVVQMGAWAEPLRGNPVWVWGGFGPQLPFP